MASGKVKWFNEKKGFGFILNDDDGEEIFVHYTAITSDGFKTLTEGANVTFSIVDTDKGRQAAEVMVEG
ncbi:MAG: cold shock domain-containing protein [bacterium]|nr:cold shock domain-containing protein [bacterium]